MAESKAYFDLGVYSRPITTSSPEAQAWFDQGLMWCYGFNHEEAVRCFQTALSTDEQCAMAYWGIAYASGPFYNKPWEFFADDERVSAIRFCHDTVQQAVALGEKASPVEKALINALAVRYPSPNFTSTDDYFRWNEDYADAMRQVYSDFSNDLDVIALMAESLMNLTPWALWDVHAGTVAKDACTQETIDILQHGIKIYEGENLPPHAGIIHLWIHVWEMSPTPERALYAADLIRMTAPDSGHLLHMASHIDVLCGQYYEAVTANSRAVAADDKYINLRGKSDFYMISCCHDLKLKMYAAMFLGQFHAAMDAMDKTLEWLSDDVMRAGTPYMQGILEGYASMRPHILVRFGFWEKITDEPMPEDPDFYVMGTAIMLYAKGVANAALGHIEAAETFRSRYVEYLDGIDKNRIFGNNLAVDVLKVGTAMLDGELEYRKSNYDAAFSHLRHAAELDDNLNYAEPWDWMHPPRHALGALLMEQGHTEEAVTVYEADLGLSSTLPRCCQHPENVWALHGYVEGLRCTGRTQEADIHDTRLQLALARTDIPIKASCCCRRSAHM